MGIVFLVLLFKFFSMAPDWAVVGFLLLVAWIDREKMLGYLKEEK